jgi:tRNA (cytidine/uridine-2'-O-)-methyltransferase
MFHVVLVEPEIPANTGNIGRTCVLTGARLHLVGPMGFELSDQALRRARLAYWESLDLRTYPDWQTFVERHPVVQDALAADAAGTQDRPSVHLLTKGGARTYAQSSYQDGDWLVFGRESAGLDASLLQAHPRLCERIPMRNDDSLTNSHTWHRSYEQAHPTLQRDICGNYVDPRSARITSLNLGNAVAIVLFEALRQTDFAGM